MGTLVGGQMLLRAAEAARLRIAAGENDPWWGTHLGLARFYFTHAMPEAGAWLAAASAGGETVFAFDESLL